MALIAAHLNVGVILVVCPSESSVSLFPHLHTPLLPVPNKPYGRFLWTLSTMFTHEKTEAMYVGSRLSYQTPGTGHLEVGSGVDSYFSPR